MTPARLRIIYRSKSHAPLWLVAGHSGVWERNGLEVDTSPQTAREKAVDALKRGEVDLISGNHHNLYARNAKHGEDFVHLAQATNNWTENRLVSAGAVASVRDLRGKSVVVDKLNSHAGLNVWLFLRQEGLDVDRGDVELVEIRGSAEERWRRVCAGEFAATFVGAPHDRRAAKAGARVIPVRPMPMIRGVTLTTTMSFVRSHSEQIRRLIRGFVEAIDFFIGQREATLKILERHAAPHIGLENDREVETLYEEWARSLERKPYPSPAAIANVFQLAVRRDPEIASFNPLRLWNTHYVRELDHGMGPGRA
ncbi:MAG TPA: ABC transporter substrate-binding protein [Candidatus Eisenbacteria bacterium]|nr:ABC transporter substrate-binding protein [Candidatus Eisenbacteria bacterium]